MGTEVTAGKAGPTGATAPQDDLGSYLRRLRKVNGKSLIQVQGETGISPNYLGQIESGKRGRPLPRFLERLAQCYAVPVGELLRRAGYVSAPVAENQELDELHRALAFAISGPEFGVILMRTTVELYQRWTGKQLLGGDRSHGDRGRTEDPDADHGAAGTGRAPG